MSTLAAASTCAEPSSTRCASAASAASSTSARSTLCLSGQAGQTNYAAAKAGMIGFTKSLALEGATRNITVNAIAPGYTATAMVSAVPPDALERILKSVPAGRLAAAAEIARGVVFLVADEAAFINGITLSINGGKYMP